MAQCPRALVALSENLGLIPSFHTAACNTGRKGSDALSWPPCHHVRARCTDRHEEMMHMYH